jgi:hypothetical protein
MSRSSCSAPGDCCDDMAGGTTGVDVAMTRNVVRSKRTTSVALQASAKVVKCLERTVALGMRVCTMLDHA